MLFGIVKIYCYNEIDILILHLYLRSYYKEKVEENKLTRAKTAVIAKLLFQ